MRLLEIKDSTRQGKKLMAIFETDTGKKTVHFGASGMDDYTLTRDKEQRDRYRVRHKKDLQTGDPTRPGFLSFYILWGNSVSRAINISAYKKRFNL